jgi:hypothetical protein
VSDSRHIAALLWQVWRERGEVDLDLPLTSDFLSLLLGSGVAPLVYRRVTGHNLRTRSFRSLRDAAHLSLLYAAARTARVEHVASTFRAAGIEPLVGKGWAVAARYYPDPGLRPSSDIDLYISPEDFEGASDLVRRRPDDLAAVDLHRGCGELRDREWASVFGKRIKLCANDTPVSTFCDEHHLRLLTLHFVKHGGYRSLWLCDVAALVERCRPALDWDEVLRGRRWRSRWVLGVVALARDLLGADVSGTPAEHVPVPPWFTKAVLHEWETPFRWPDGRPPADRRIFSGGLIHAARELRSRWPSPVEASFNFAAPPNDFPRLPYELLQLGRQSFDVVRRSLAASWSREGENNA